MNSIELKVTGMTCGHCVKHVSEALQAAGVLRPLLQLGLKDEFIEHGDHAQLLALQGLDAAGMEAAIRIRFGELKPTDPLAAKVVLKSVA